MGTRKYRPAPPSLEQEGIQQGKEEMAHESTRSDGWTTDSVLDAHNAMHEADMAAVRAGNMTPYQAHRNRVRDRAARNEMLRQIRSRG